MKYKIVNTKDNQTVEDDLSKEAADKKIIFYDTEEAPHQVVAEDAEALWQQIGNSVGSWNLGVKARRRVAKDDHLMPMAEFMADVEAGGLNDDDGSGAYSDGVYIFEESVEPSDVFNGNLKKKYSHVVWFNK